MKKILITGANSYIGTSFENYMKNFADEYEVSTLDMINESWKEESFKEYDVVFHVAGIAHRKETKDSEHLYYKVNKELTIEVAKKAKENNVKHFIFLSSMSVYGMNIGIITKHTKPNPKTFYGKSKLEAEIELEKLADENFNVTMLRPPMVYGKDCRGNFQTIVKLVKKFNFFPKIKNERSLIYIDNLCKYIKQIIDTNKYGLLFPQNPYKINTSKMAKVMAEQLNKKLHLSIILGVLVKCATPLSSKIKKAFGSLTYDIEDEVVIDDMVEFEESIKKSI